MRVPTNIAFCTHTENTAIWMITDGLQVGEGGEREGEKEIHDLSVLCCTLCHTRAHTRKQCSWGRRGQITQRGGTACVDQSCIFFFLTKQG